jgi:hypothetical protein
MDVKRPTYSLCIRSLVATYPSYKNSLIRGHLFHLLINSSGIREVKTYQGTISIVHITSFSHLLSNHVLSLKITNKHFLYLDIRIPVFTKLTHGRQHVICTHFLLRLSQIFHKTVLKVSIRDFRPL